MEDKGSAVTEACKAKKALTYHPHFLSDISAFIEHGKLLCQDRPSDRSDKL